jgi:hypothetical protein
MGKVLIIGVIVLASIFGGLINYMNRNTRNLPAIVTTDLTYKEATNINSYAIHYAVQYAKRNKFTVPLPGDSLVIERRFDNFPITDGFIDSIFYRYIPEKNFMRIQTFSRAQINHVMKSVQSEAGMKIPPPYLMGSVANWAMDEESWDGVSYDVIDSSENENDGNANNGADTIEDSEFGYVGYFDGINDFVHVPHDPSLNLLDSFTLCIWGNINPSAISSTLLWKDSGLIESNLRKYPCYGMIWREHGGGKPNSFIGSVVTMGLDGSVSPASYKEVNCSFVPDGNWHLFSLVFDGSFLKLYIDAVLQDKIAIPSGQYVYSSAYDLYIGVAYLHHEADGHPFRDRYYDGTLDDMGVWNEPLTQEQILEIFEYKMRPPLIYVRE